MAGSAAHPPSHDNDNASAFPPYRRRLCGDNNARSRRHLLFTSAGDNTDFETRWCVDPARTFDVWVVYYGSDRAVYDRYVAAADRVEHRRGSKFQNFAHVYNAHREELLARYDRFFIVDDDILISSEDVDRLLARSVAHDLWLCQPAFVPPSKISHRVTRRDPARALRYTDFVEVNTPVIANEALPRCMEAYDPRLVGWGIDYLFVWALGRTERRRYAIVDEVPCVNPQDDARPLGKSGGGRELMRAAGAADRAATWRAVADEKGCPRDWEPRVWE